MFLIPQTKTMACWYASAQMLIWWRREQVQMCESGIFDPSEDPILKKMQEKDKGVSNSALIHMAQKLGLETIPPMSPSEAGLESWLKQYGPLWVNGNTHIVVIAGIRPGEVLVYDPSPLNTGKVDWRTLAGWYVGGNVDSRDTSDSVEAVFLHCPRVPSSTPRPKVTHTVVPGDSLWKLAVKYYNDGGLWPFIHAANKSAVKNPNLIRVGQVLTIP
jgi:nucleoid-associated protein YgaU